MWGASFAASGGSEPFPADAGTRIARFTELIGIALANAQARLDLQELADEQAALRRVAEIAARGGSQANVLDAVVTEASRLLALDVTTLWQFGVDGASVAVAIHGDDADSACRGPLTKTASCTVSSRRAGRP